MKNNEDIFECFSLNLHAHLSVLGFKPLYYYKHKTTKRLCFVYAKTSDLRKVLGEWSAKKS